MAGRKNLEGPGVNYFQLPRKQLQSLCKKYGFPANKTNQHMAEFFTSLLDEKSSVKAKECKYRIERDLASNEKRRRNGFTLPAGMETNTTSKTWAEQFGQLLPAIPDDITLTNITPKLPWRDVHTLSSVSRGLRKSVASRQVYIQRVRSHSTKTLAVIHEVRRGRAGINAAHEDIHVLSLYSITDKCSYDLPPIPFCDGGIPSACQHVSLDGKVYVLGGVMDRARDLGSKEVYVLDLALAGQGRWKRCARMGNARLNFGASILDGKIYVFGGSSLLELVSACEVYDPKVNAWSPIKPLPNVRVNVQVATVGEEIVLYGKRVYADRDHTGRPMIHNMFVVDAYDPIKDEWKAFKPLTTIYWDETFVAQGIFYLTTRSGIYAYATDENLWCPLHSFSTDPVCKCSQGSLAHALACPAMALGDELLFAIMFCEPSDLRGSCLFQTKGFGSKRNRIGWEGVCHLFLDSRSSFACPVQL